MTDNEIMQEFFDSVVVAGRLNTVVNVGEFVSGVQSLQKYGPTIASDPADVLSGIKQVFRGIGSELFIKFVSLEESHPGIGLDDFWSRWCPCPAGIELHRIDYPAGALPLWSNGRQTLFCCLSADGGGCSKVTFGVHS